MGRYYISEDYYNKSLKGFTVKGSDIIISCAGTIGEMFILPRKIEKGVINQALMRVRVNENIMNKKIFMCVFDNMINSFTRKFSNGSAIKNIPPFADLKAYIVFLPSKDEQTKIALLLSKLDERIAVQTKIINKLQSLIKGLCNHFYYTLSSCKKQKLNSCCDFYSGGTPSSTDPKFYGGPIPFIRSGEIKSNITELFITEEGLNNSSAKLVMKEDVLLALYGATSGEISISRIDGAINQAILCIKTTLNPYYFKAIWESKKDNILSTYLQGGQGNLSADIIKSISFPIPTNDIQNTIANIYKQIDNKLSIEKVALNLLQKQKRYLLQQMFI